MENAYLVFFGRPVESLQALNIHLCLTIEQLKHRFVTCNEFATFIAGPIIASKWLDADRFLQPVEPRLTTWVLARLDLVASARRAVKDAVTWPDLMVGLIEDFQERRSGVGAPAVDWEPERLLESLHARRHELNASLAHVGGGNGIQLRLTEATWIATRMILIQGVSSVRGSVLLLEAVVDGRVFAANLLDIVADSFLEESHFSCLVHVDFEPGWSGPEKVGLRVACDSDHSGLMALTRLSPLVNSKSLENLLEALAPVLRGTSTAASLSTAAWAAETALESKREQALRSMSYISGPTPKVSIVVPVAGGSHRIRQLLYFIDVWAAELDYEVVFAPTSPDLEPTISAAVRAVDIAGRVRMLSPGEKLPISIAAHMGLVAALSLNVLLMSDGYIPPRTPFLNTILNESAASSSVVALRSAFNFDGTRHSVRSTIAAVYRCTETRVDLLLLDVFRTLPSDLAPGLVAASREVLLELLVRLPILLTSEMFWLSLIALSDQLAAPECLNIPEMTYIGFQPSDNVEALLLDDLILRQRLQLKSRVLVDTQSEVSS